MDIYIVHAVQDGSFLPVRAFFDAERAEALTQRLTREIAGSVLAKRAGLTYVTIPAPFDAGIEAVPS